MNFVIPANNHFWGALTYQIGSLHTHCFNQLDNIFVYNLGFLPAQLNQLSKMSKVLVREVPPTYQFTTIPRLKHPRKNPNSGYAQGLWSFKPPIIQDVFNQYPDIHNLFYSDAGNLMLKDLTPLQNELETHGYFFTQVGELGWMTTTTVINTFKLLNENLSQPGTDAGFFGLSRTYIPLILDPWLACVTPDLELFIDDGTASGGFDAGRHDQTLLSIFVDKQNLNRYRSDKILLDNRLYKIPADKKDIDKYAIVVRSRGCFGEEYRERIKYH